MAVWDFFLFVYGIIDCMSYAGSLSPFMKYNFEALPFLPIILAAIGASPMIKTFKGQSISNDEDKYWS
jgi:hypothetical protein